MLGALIMLMLWIFIATPLIVGKARYMLEARSYYDTHIGRITFSWRVKRSKSTALIMASKQILWIFWCLTIVGGFIKHYSYKMIPYILAENPDINRKEAFELSKKMMYGQKWNAFKLDLSFIKWDILNVITLGTLKWLFLKPYKEATCTELYLVLREEIKAVSVENSYLLFDDYIGVEPGKGVYPWVNYPLSERVVSNWLRIQPKRKYSIFSLTMFFFTFSFIGWLWEVTIHIVEDGAFINRGTMFGPWLPIYGTGGILIIILLGKFVEKPWLTFILAVGVCGLLEYFTATLLWELVGVKWWDYSGYFFNIHGKVCAEGLIIFGIGGMAGIYILAPFLNNLYSRIAKERKIAICCILLILFSVDLVYSYFNPNMGEGITADIRFGFTNVGSIKEQSVQKLLIEK